MSVEYLPPSLTDVAFRRSQAARDVNTYTRTLDDARFGPYSWLQTNLGILSIKPAYAALIPLSQQAYTTHYLGASDVDELTLAREIGSYPASFWVYETSYVEYSIGNTASQYFEDDGVSSPMPPADWVVDFWSNGLQSVYQGATYVSGATTNAIVREALDLKTRNHCFVPVSSTTPGASAWTQELHRSRPQLLVNNFDGGPVGSGNENCYYATGYSAGWTFSGPYTFRVDSPRKLILAPTLTADGNGIADATPIPECRAGLALDLGWDATVLGGPVYWARTCVICWGDLLAIDTPIVGGLTPSVNIPIQWKAAPDWVIVSADNDTNFPSIQWDGFAVDEATSATGWTTFATITVDGSGNATGVTISGTQPAIGALAVIRVGYEASGMSNEDIVSATNGVDVVFNFGPTRLPFAIRTTTGLIPGWA